MKTPELRAADLRRSGELQDLVLTLDGRVQAEPKPTPTAKAPAPAPKPIEVPQETWD